MPMPPAAVTVSYPAPRAAPAERTMARTRRMRTALALVAAALICAMSPLAVFRPARRAATAERTRTRRTRTALALAIVALVCAMSPLAAFFPTNRAAPAERTRTRTALALAAILLVCAMSPLAVFLPARRAALAERTPSRTRRMRTALALAIVALVCAMSPLAACGGASATDFNGTALSDGGPAPDFVLTDQFGDSVSLADMRGRAVALSFLFTGCPDVCPVVTTQLKRLYDELGADADSVEFVSVSVDPERDDPQAAMRYLERWGVANEWRYLTGARADLEPIWAAYYISPVIDDADAAARISSRQDAVAATTTAPKPSSGGAIDALRSEIAERHSYSILHSAPVYLIDRDGTRRLVFTPPLDAARMASDIRALLGE